MAAPVERKVTAATGASAAGVALAGAILWALDTYAFTDQPVPDALVVLVWALIPAGLTFLGGWLARHTHRADPVVDRLVAREDVKQQFTGIRKIHTSQPSGTWTTGSAPGEHSRDPLPPPQ